jgi:hypothetical protein
MSVATYVDATMDVAEPLDPWSDAPLIEKAMGVPFGKMRKCSGYGPTRDKTQGLVVGDYVRFQNPGKEESSIATRLLVILPGDKRGKSAVAAEWADKRVSAETGEMQGGWGQSIVPFAANTCWREGNGLQETYIDEYIKAPETYVFVNQVDCELRAKTTTEVNHRPVAIACVTISNDVWRPEHGRDMEDISRDMHDTTHEISYTAGKTFVLEFKVLCGHRHFAAAGGNMMRKVVQYTRDLIARTHDRHTHFICVADAVNVPETRKFYQKMGFIEVDIIATPVFESGVYVAQDKSIRCVRVVRV